MGFFTELFGSKKVGSLAPGRGWVVPVVGEAQYQDTLKKLYRKNGGAGHDIKVSAVLMPEDGNAFDVHAVRVEIASRPVGYLPREMAQEYRAALRTTASECSAKIVGGFEMDDGSLAHFGVKLNASWPPRMK